MLKKRIKSAILLLGISSICIFVDHFIAQILFFFFASGLLFLSFKEVFSMLPFPILSIHKFTIFIISYIYLIYLFYLGMRQQEINSNIDTIFLVALAVLLFIPTFFMKDNKKGISSVLVSLGTYIYWTWSLLFLVKLYFYDIFDIRGAFVLLFFILGVKFGDIGGYVVGSLWNKYIGQTSKIIPRVSKGKSWQGLLGGFVFSFLCCGIFKLVLFDEFSWIQIFLFSLVFTLLGFIGDIAESVLKRSANFKDASSVLPGMGGVLDVVDSFAFTAPLFYYYLTTIS